MELGTKTDLVDRARCEAEKYVCQHGDYEAVGEVDLIRIDGVHSIVRSKSLVLVVRPSVYSDLFLHSWDHAHNAG